MIVLLGWAFVNVTAVFLTFITCARHLSKMEGTTFFLSFGSFRCRCPTSLSIRNSSYHTMFPLLKRLLHTCALFLENLKSDVSTHGISCWTFWGSPSYFSNLKETARTSHDFVVSFAKWHTTLIRHLTH